jgi:hypothetical protein
LAEPAETVKEKPKVTAPGKPLESEIGTKYKDWSEYNEALVDWTAERKLDARLAERDQKARERETTEIQSQRDATYHEAAAEFAKMTPDFNERIDAATKAGMKLPAPIIECIQDLPNAPAIVYYLATNPDEALEIVKAHPAQGFVMLGRISQGLESESQVQQPAPKVPAKKPISAAPVPVKPVAGHSARSTETLQDISKRSTDDYIRVRTAQIKEAAQRRYL